MVVTGDWSPPSSHTTDSSHFLLTLSILRSSSELLPPTQKQTRFRELITLDYTIVIAASYGDHWRNLRRIGSVEIFSNHRLSSFLSIRKDEIGDLSYVSPETFHKNEATKGLMNCDFISIRTCKEIEGKFCDYIEHQYQKKVLLTGPMFPEPDKSKPLEDRWSHWLSGFGQGSVVFCALGSQVTLAKDQFQELCLGMELTGLPFLVAVTPPQGAKTIQEALPEGFEERVKGRGVVWGEWVQQPLILAHPSVGCFVSHCGFGSMWESLMSGCQIVLLPFLADQVLNTRLMTEELEVSVEVKREETGWFLKESLSVAVTSVMDQDSEIGNLVRRNHSKLKEVLVRTGYTDKFVDTLENIVNDTKLK